MCEKPPTRNASFSTAGRPSARKGSPPPPRPRIRVVPTPIFHEGTFRAILHAALLARACLRHRGAYWQPIDTGRGFGLYRRSSYDLAWIQERVADYELFFYGRLLLGHAGPDGALHPRAKLRRGPGGAYRPADQPARPPR